MADKSQDAAGLFAGEEGVMKRLVRVLLIGVIVMALSGAGYGQAQVKEYSVPAFRDFSGPYADLMKFIMPTIDAVFGWWNETEGQKLGVKLAIKNHDTRYDATVVASLWPGILADKPFIAAGLGGPDVAALQQRLPQDKVPVCYSTAAYGFGWLPNQWIFQPRPTYSHEQIAALTWFIEQNPNKRPVKVATLTTQASPAYLDIVNGTKKYIEEVLEPKGLAKVVAQQWIDIQPVDVSAQLKAIIDARADIIFGMGNTAMAGALMRAQQLHGVNIPTVAAPHHTIWPLSVAMKTFQPWEGHFDVGAVVSSTEKEGKAYEFFKTLEKKYGLKEDLHWSPFGMLGFTQGIFMARAVEHAARKVGGANLTGQAVYDAFFEKPLTEDELMGILPTLHFTREAPFSTKDLKVKIATVKNGKYQPAAPGWVPVPPDIKKW
jgi:branched-chain amino acid transport system substrate-binding protein